MATRPTTEVGEPERLGGFEPEALIRAFRIMYLSRRIDDREILLKRQKQDLLPDLRRRTRSHSDRRRHGAAARPRLVLSLLSRPRAVPGARRDRRRHAAAGASAPQPTRLPAAARCPRTGARRACTSSVRPRPPERSSCRRSVAPTPSAASTRTPTRHAGVTTGDGATSEGEFWESLNVACLEQLPLLFLVEDNGWAISVPVEGQTAGGNIARLVSGFPNLHTFRKCDGTDFLASYAAMCRGGRALPRAVTGPRWCTRTCTRPYSHSLSDDERLYKTTAERARRSRARSGASSSREWLIAEGLLDPHGLELHHARSRARNSGGHRAAS